MIEPLSPLIIHIEALIFCSQMPAKVHEIQACVAEILGQKITEEEVQQAINELDQKYQSASFAFQLYKTGGGYQFMTKPAYHKSVSIMLRQLSQRKLSTAALEVLAIIAYRQPISKPDIESIRGVNSEYALRKLLERKLINISGKADTLGRPLLYSVSDSFMEYLGISDMSELPSLKEFSYPEENAVGEPTSIDEIAEN